MWLLYWLGGATRACHQCYCCFPATKQLMSVNHLEKLVMCGWCLHGEERDQKTHRGSSNARRGPVCAVWHSHSTLRMQTADRISPQQLISSPVHLHMLSCFIPHPCVLTPFFFLKKKSYAWYPLLLHHCFASSTRTSYDLHSHVISTHANTTILCLDNDIINIFQPQ